MRKQSLGAAVMIVVRSSSGTEPGYEAGSHNELHDVDGGAPGGYRRVMALGNNARHGLRGALAGLLLGLVIAVVTYAVVKPGPCSEGSMCQSDGHGGCRLGPCDGRSHHIVALLLVVAIASLVGFGVAYLRRNRR
jgi:hypothetical protein